MIFSSAVHLQLLMCTRFLVRRSRTTFLPRKPYNLPTNRTPHSKEPNAVAMETRKRTPDLADVFTFQSHAFSTQFLFAEVLGSALLPMRFSFSPFPGRVLARFFLARFFETGFQKRCEGVYCVDLGERFPTDIWLQSSASIQRRTSL